MGSEFVLRGEDLPGFLSGTWKRNLEWRSFGDTFQHLRTSNTIVHIEEAGSLREAEPGTRHLRWSFGKSARREDLRFGYIMKFSRPPRSADTYLEWQYCGTLCHGKFMPTGSPVMVLNFWQQKSTVTATYRLIDENSMAVCIVEVDDKQSPTIQYGNMFRIHPEAYES